MDFNFSKEDEAFRKEFRKWLKENLPKTHRKSDFTIEFMSGEEGDEWERRLEWHKKVYAAGWVAPHWPKEYGGRGASLTQQLIYNEELTQFSPPSLVNGQGIGLVGPTLMHWGSEEQRQRYLKPMLAAEEIWCQGYSEPGSGSDLASLQTRAVEDGDYFVVNGQKVWTSQAQYSDWCFLLVRTDPNAPKHQGISYILVDMHSPGITVRPLVQITGDAEFNEVFFEEVRVPKKNLVGELNRGWMVAITTLMFERVATGSFFRFEKLMPQLIDLARRIELNGRPAIEDTSMRQQLAQFAIEAAAIKYNDLRRLTRQLKGQPPGPEGSFSKITTTELNFRIANFAMELLGPYSVLEKGSLFAMDHARWARRMLGARAGTIAAGTNEIQRGIIGERVLGLPKGR